MSPKFNSERVVCPDKYFLAVCAFSSKLRVTAFRSNRINKNLSTRGSPLGRHSCHSRLFACLLSSKEIKECSSLVWEKTVSTYLLGRNAPTTLRKINARFVACWNFSDLFQNIFQTIWPNFSKASLVIVHRGVYNRKMTAIYLSHDGFT